MNRLYDNAAAFNLLAFEGQRPGIAGDELIKNRNFLKALSLDKCDCLGGIFFSPPNEM